MRKYILLLTILTLTAWQGKAQSMQGYEYWFDDDYTARTAVTSSQPDVSFEADYSSLQAGLHYLNFRAQGSDGQWGALSRMLVYLTADSRGSADMVAYEYWMDSDYSSRTSVAGSGVQAFTVDVSNLQAGLHYLNFRAQGSDGQWGALSRMLVYLTADSRGSADMVAYEYWMDSDYANRTAVSGSTVDSPITLDISNLQFGLHYFNFRAQGSDGQWGGLSRYLFYVKQDVVGQLANLDYWIDERNDVMTQQVTDSTVVITMDIANLSVGYHTFNIEGRTQNGDYSSLLASYEFVNEEIPAGNAEPYAVLTGDTLLTFYYDDQKAVRNGININNSYLNDNYSSPYGSATTAVIDASFANYRPTSTASWFQKCSSLTRITGLENLKTDEVMDMHYMFSDCSGLTGLDLANFNTPNVTNMSAMFSHCSSLTSLDLSSFNTQNVTNMSFMFRDCSGLTSLDVSGFDTQNVTNMDEMFYGCISLTSLNLSGFNTQNVTRMFWMFRECSGLTNLNVTGFNTQNVADMRCMFFKCSGLTTLDVTGFNTQNVRDMTGMFADCSSLTTIYAGSNWSTAAVTNGGSMFTNSTNLKGGAGTTYNADHTNYTYAHIDGGPSNPGYFTDKNAPVGDASFDGLVATISGERMLDEAFDSIGGRSEAAKTIAAIVWDKSKPLTQSDLQGIDNPNLLIYVAADSLAPADRNNVVVNGIAKNVVLVDAKEGNNNFYAPQAFTAEMVSYSREFSQETMEGVSRGWEAIALPFDVQTITHEKWAVIAPFGDDTSNKHFWLRKLSHDGLVRATKIEANVPYIISMPKDAVNYLEEFLLAGRVTFSAQNVTIPATEPVILALADSTIKMVPAFQRVGRASDVWALNVGEVRGQYFEGSVFERDYREVHPFEAYTVHNKRASSDDDNPSPRTISVRMLMGQDATGIVDLRWQKDDGMGERWYSIDGRKLQQKPSKKGVYIKNGKKIVLK